MSSPLVSVIIPNYNHQFYLEQRIDCVLAQSFTDFEIILLDDCSTDNSRSILESYQTNQLVSHIVFNNQNSGSTFKQWDKGMQLAKGKYIWIAESDDFADTDFLLKTVSLLEKHPNAVIAFSGSQMVDENGCSINLDWDKYPSNIATYSLFDNNEFLQKQMLWKNSIYNASMALFKKECIAHIDSFFQSYKYCGDWLFWVEMARQGDVIRINQKLNYFRQHTNKVSPLAEKEGLYFLEGYSVIDRVSALLNLSSYQRSVIKGRLMKRFKKALRDNPGLHVKIQEIHPLFFENTSFAIPIYIFDELFNISKLY